MSLRVAALLDGPVVPAWHIAALRRIMSSGEPMLIMILHGARGIRENRMNPLLRVYSVLDRKMFRYRPDALRPEGLRTAFQGIATREVTFEDREDGSSTLSAPDVESLRALGIDVILYLGERTLAGSVLSIPASGVWYYEFGNGKRMLPPALQELIGHEPVVQSSLRMIQGEDSSTARTLVRSFSRTHRLSHNKGLNISLWKSASFASRKLMQLSRAGEKKSVTDLNAREPAFGDTHTEIPGTFRSLAFLLRQVWRTASTLFVRKFTFDQWWLAFSQGRGFGESFQDFTRIIPPRDRFWADPHVLRRDGECYLFLEEYLYSSGKGHIAVMKINGPGEWTKPVLALERDYHLSYPFVFSWQGICYMIPETSKNRTIELYQCSRFPDSWVLSEVLMEQVRAVDTTLLHHNGRWWLFTNIAEQDGGETTDELFLFYADDFRTTGWTPHAMNPIVSDCRRSRPAGRIFGHGGCLYRPSQDCSEEYGGGINFNRIVRLSETEYEEVPVSSYKPGWDKRVIGLHSYSYDDNVKVIDLCVRRRRW